MASFREYTNNKKKKKKKENELTQVNSTGKSFKEYTKSVLGDNFVDDDIAPVRQNVTMFDTTSMDNYRSRLQAKEEEENSGWLRKSEGTTKQAVGASSLEIGGKILEGLAGVGEKLTDAFATISPYLLYGDGTSFQTTKQRERTEKLVQEAKTDMSAFVKKDLYNEEQLVAKHIVNPLERKYGLDVDRMSVFGAKSEELAKSAGQMGANIAASAINPFLGTAMLGATSFGSEAENAFNQGATYDEAVLSASISAGAEILSEKLSGGISLGGKTLDDLMPIDKLTQGISNKLVRNLINVGVDATGEGFEEIVAGYASAVGQKLTYMDEKEINEIFSSEEALDSFLGGAILGGISSTGKTAIDTVKGKDSLSGMTKTEKMVFDKVYNDTISEQEKDGKKLSQKEKNEIYDDVLKKLERGYIDTDTIESVIGGEIYNKLKSVTDEETKLQEKYDSMKKEFDTLNKMKIGEMTGEQTDRKAELKNQLEKLKEKLKNSSESQIKTEIRSQLDSEMLKATQGTKLFESYREKARRGQELEVDVESYKSDSAKQTAQNFKDFRDSNGYGVNNTNATHDYLDLLTKVAEDRGQTFKFYTTKQLEEAVASGEYNIEGEASKVEAFVDKGKNEIIINMDANKSLNSLVGHEITHTLETDKTSYEPFQKALIELSKTRGEYESRWESIQRRYSKENGYTEEQQLQELTSDLVGDYIFGDSDFVQNLSTENPNIFKKIYNEIKYLWNMATAGSKEKRQLETAKKKFEDAWRQANNTSIDADVKLYVREKTENVSDRLSGREWNQVKSAVANYSKLNYHYEKSSNGDIIIPVNNKLVYTDANFDSPGISKIIEINSDIENEVDEARSWIYGAEKGKYSITDAYEAIESITGNGIINEYSQKSSSNDKGYDRRTGRGKSKSDSYHASFLQERIRRANEIINSVNSEQTSSEDGVFFDAQTSDADISYSQNDDGTEIKTDRESEIQYSLANDTQYMDNAIAKNNSSLKVDSKLMEDAKVIREKIVVRMNEIKDRGLVGLPEDIEGNTFISNSSYGGTEENTTICPRSLSAEAFVDAVSEMVGRPLTVEEQIYLSQDLQGRSLTPECTYCYVATDRKAYRAFLGEYVAQRDAVLEKLKENPNMDFSTLRKDFLALKNDAKAELSPIGEVLKEFLNGRKPTEPMYKRFKMWTDAYQNGRPLIDANHLANMSKLMGDINSEFGAELKPQIADAMKYAQSASWAKKRVNYLAYNGHILKWKQDRINKLNSHYGLRMYSFSDFHPAFTLENMQMITDASVRGLKMLGYTKDTDFVEIFAPSGMNINISTFGFVKDGVIAENNLIGAEWQRAKELREQYPNVGITFVATDDTLVNWALDQDWIDVVIPFHLVRTGKEVAKAFKYTDYTSESSDTKTADWKKGDKKYIAPTEHNNDKATYLEALEKNHLKPRFDRFIEHPNYMKLVNECRLPASESKPVQPIFNEDASMKALAKLEANGYYQPVGGSVDRMYEIAAEVADKMQSEIAPTQYRIADDIPSKSYGHQYYAKDLMLAPTVENSSVVDTSTADLPIRSDYAPLTEEDANVRDDRQIDEHYFLDDMPTETEEEYNGNYAEHMKPADPFYEKDIWEVGRNRKQKAYMYENPEVKPFFQSEANYMLGELNNSQKGEKFYNDQLYYDTNGEMGWFGTQRFTSEDIAYLLDTFNYTYKDIEKGLKAIIEDNGKENNAISKRIEFLIDERLRTGYTEFMFGEKIPPNQEYINLLNSKEITQYNDESWNNWLRGLSDEEVAYLSNTREDIAPPSEYYSADSNDVMETVAPVEAPAEKKLTLYDAQPRKGVVKGQQSMFEEKEKPKAVTRSGLHSNIINNIKNVFQSKGLDFDDVLKNAKNLSTFSTVDNIPQRVMEKALGYKQGQVLSDLTVNKVAQNESEGIKWLNSFTDRKSGLLKQISKQYNIKAGSKESAAAQMYAEGFYVNDNNEIIKYGDAELAKDFPNQEVRENIKALAKDERIRQIYDETLMRINESRTRNAYPEIPRLDNYFLHFRAMDDTFSRLGLPFNPNDIRAKDLPTDLNGVTADLKPGQPYFASAMHRTGKRTSFDLLGGLERYLTSAKNQIYHIDDIQTLRALRNYIADTYGQANGLAGLDALSEEEAQNRIEQVYNSHLSTFAKFLNEEANVLAGKTALIDRGLEGIIGRRGITFLNTVNGQVGSNMVGFNFSSSLTNFLPVVQTFAKTNKADFVKAFAQTTSNKIGSVFGRSDGFAEESPVIIRRKGADRFYRTPFQKVGDTGYILMSAVDDISTELIARTKYNELTRKGMDSQQAHYETDKWVSRLMGDRSLGQMPQLYNSKMLGLVTKFQLEVRNQLDSQFYDTIQEAKVSSEHIQNGLEKNARIAAKVASTFTQLAIAQHLFGKAFESVVGYNPAFDIVEVLLKTVGYDDDEESEDTMLDNVEQGFLMLLEDLPYTSTFTGGRIPISSALPIEEFITGKDEYGNEKSRLETLGEVAPYYVLPTGYGQLKKTYQGLSMFDEDLPISGSYTDSGNLRFPVEDTHKNRLQAGLFGQWASENARDYFDNERKPLEEKQIQEFIDVDLPIRDYWEYREGLSGLKTLSDKADYINSLDLPIDKKNILVNNQSDRKEPIDLTGFDDDYANFEEFDFAMNNPEKYEIALQVGGYKKYQKYQEGMSGMKLAEKIDYVANLDDLSIKQKNALINGETDKKEPIDLTGYENYDSYEEFELATDNPKKYSASRVLGYDEFINHDEKISDFNAKDASGNTVSGLKKKRTKEYIFSRTDLDYGEKAILFRCYYDKKADKDEYNPKIIKYLESRDDISSKEMISILESLDMKVTGGRITW